VSPGCQDGGLEVSCLEPEGLVLVCPGWPGCGELRSHCGDCSGDPRGALVVELGHAGICCKRGRAGSSYSGVGGVVTRRR